LKGWIGPERTRHRGLDCSTDIKKKGKSDAQKDKRLDGKKAGRGHLLGGASWGRQPSKQTPNARSWMAIRKHAIYLFSKGKYKKGVPSPSSARGKLVGDADERGQKGDMHNI